MGSRARDAAGSHGTLENVPASLIAPFHPDYFALPPIRRDVAEAKRLLAAAGHPGGVDISLALGNTQGRWEQETAEVLHVSTDTVKRDWRLAKLWLLRELQGDA